MAAKKKSTTDRQMIPVCSAQFNSLHPCGWRPQRKFNPSVSACLQFAPSIWTETRVGFFSSSSTSLQFTPPLRVETLAKPEPLWLSFNSLRPHGWRYFSFLFIVSMSVSLSVLHSLIYFFYIRKNAAGPDIVQVCCVPVWSV